MDMDMSQNPFLTQLISTSELSPTEVREIFQIAGSINGQVQLATVIKSGVKSILITIKNSLVNIPALSILQFIKPENINPTLTFDEHRSIYLHTRSGKPSSLFSNPMFQQPFFLIAKNMMFSMVVKDVTSLLQTYNNQPPPIEQALKKLDKYFDTVPESPIPENQFVPMTNPLETDMEDFWDELNKASKNNSEIASGIHTPSPKRQLSLSDDDVELSPKRSKSISSINSWEQSIDSSERLKFTEEISRIFPSTDETE